MTSPEKEFSVSEDVKELINDIIAKNNWEPVSDVKYYPGSEVGDGYASKHVAVDILKETGDVKLFVKYALNIKAMMADIPVQKFYSNETYFYDILYPAYLKFSNENKAGNDITYVPKCYGTSSKNVIALENIRNRGFSMIDRRKPMDEKHIILVMKTFAKFHAVSFAFKDQDKEGYEELVKKWDGDFMAGQSRDAPAMKMFLDMIQAGLDKLDSQEDKRILEKCKADDLSDCILDVSKTVNEYSIFTQGDCWCNNIMFLYQDENKKDPIDIMLVDWQILRPASVAYDLSYFFYTIASEESLAKLDFYLDIYYTELCEKIKHFGSQPDVLYPLSVFRQEWKQYCKYGFAMAFMLLKFMLVNQDEAPKMDDFDFTDMEKMEKAKLFAKFDNEEEYIRRLRRLANFMVDNQYV